MKKCTDHIGLQLLAQRKVKDIAQPLQFNTIEFSLKLQHCWRENKTKQLK